jgi:hypothetical protein
MNTHPRYVPALLLALCLTPSLAQAQPPAARHPHGPPPAAAFEACKDKQANDSCQMMMGERTINGQCATTPDARLACRPEPKPEMTAACSGKSEGDSCAVQLGDRRFEGQCRPDDGGQLMCRPPHPER